MVRNRLNLSLVALSAAVLVSASLFADVCHWKGGADGLWKTPANWVGEKMPVAGDDVVINADAADCGGENLVKFDNYQKVAVRNLTILKTVNFQQGRIDLDGDLTIADGCKLTMEGSWDKYSIYLSAGEHVIDCQGTGKSSLAWTSVVGGPGTFIKRGTGAFTLPEQHSGEPGWGAFDVCGIEVYEGELTVSNHHLPNVTNIVVDGASSRIFLSATGTNIAGAEDAINHNAVVKITRGGGISDSGSGLSYTVKELWTDDGQRPAGTYTPASLPNEALRRTITITVTDNPPPSVRYWKGGADRRWTTAANWAEGVVPAAWDDVVINADAVDSGGESTAIFDDLQTVSVRNLTILKTMNFKTGRINLGGDLAIADGCKLVMTGSYNSYSLYLPAGEHVIDCRGTGKSDFVWSVIVGGPGTFIKRGMGAFKLPEQHSGVPGWGAFDVGGIEVYEGELYVNNRHMPNVTNIVIDGAAAWINTSATAERIEGAEDAINHDAVVRISNGGRFSDSGARLDYTVREFYLDGAVLAPGTYTAADYPDNLRAGISVTVTDMPHFLRVGEPRADGANLYKSVQAAFDAVGDGETVTLLESFPFTETVVITNKADIVIDLNGKTATYSGNGYFAQIAGTAVTVVDSSAGKTGGFVKKGAGTMIEVGSSEVASSLTLDSGSVVFAGENTLLSDAACVKVKNGCFTMNGGTLDNGGNVAESAVRVCADGAAVFNGGAVTGPVLNGEGGVVSIPVCPDGVLNEVRFSVNPGNAYLDNQGKYRMKHADGWWQVVERRLRFTIKIR